MSRKPKIVINAVSAKMGGAVSYITNLLRHLATVRGDFQFLVFLPPETAAKVASLAPGIRVLRTGIGHAGMLKRMWWEQVTLRRFVKREGIDVLVSTANFAMFRCPVRQLLLVQNALYFSKVYREIFLPRHSLQYRITFRLRRWLILRSAMSADVVMMPTQAVLDELRCFMELKEAVVNPYGVVTPELPKKWESDMRHRLDVGANRVVRVLYVSLYADHKNLGTLLKALLILNKDKGGRFTLTTTACPGWKGGGGIAVSVQDDLDVGRQCEDCQSVEFVEPLDLDGTERLYQEADIFAFPSVVESFGLPMVEALSYGLPIVAADTPVNHEICGESAIYFSPFSPEDLAEKIRHVANNRELCLQLSAAGRSRAATFFRWSSHSTRLLECAETLVKNTSEDTMELPEKVEVTSLFRGPH